MLIREIRGKKKLHIDTFQNEYTKRFTFDFVCVFEYR